MNKYYKWYLDIINFRKQHVLSKKTTYCEIHHIIPRSLNGSNNKENLVALTAREHYICHCLLIKHFEYINDKIAYNKMLFAWNRLSHDKRHTKINSKLYEKLRIKNSIRAKQFKHTEETIKKCRNAQLGKKSSIEVRLKQSKSLKGKTKPESMKKLLSDRVKNTTVVYNPKTNVNKQIKTTDLDSFLKNGWLHQYSPTVKAKKSKETSGENNPCYGKKWIYNIVTDEQKYVLKDEAIKIVNESAEWKFGLNKEKRLRFKYRKHRPKALNDEKQQKSLLMKNKVWVLNPLTNEKRRPDFSAVKHFLKNGWILISKKYKISDFD